MTEKQKEGTTMVVLMCLVLGIFCWSIFWDTSEDPPPEPIVIHDSIYISGQQAEAKTKYIYRTVHDTMIVTETDTIAVSIPIDHKQYTDTFLTDTSSIMLDIKYSGYMAKIDGIGLDYRFEVEPVTVTKKKGWGQFVGVGIGAGYGLGITANPHFEPYIGISVVYGFGYHW